MPEEPETDDEPTEFGPVSAILRVTSDGWTIDFSNNFRQAPKRLVIRLPWFYQVDHVTADGVEMNARSGELTVPVAVRQISVTGKVKADTPALSFNQPLLITNASIGLGTRSFSRPEK